MNLVWENGDLSNYSLDFVTKNGLKIAKINIDFRAKKLLDIIMNDSSLSFI